MRLNEHRGKQTHRRPIAGPLWNRLPVLTMAAGHLHLRQDSGHQRAKEVTVSKLAELPEGGSEQSAASLMRLTCAS